jgi:hypothetical protein
MSMSRCTLERRDERHDSSSEIEVGVVISQDFRHGACELQVILLLRYVRMVISLRRGMP